jgi:hypothetical protein
LRAPPAPESALQRLLERELKVIERATLRGSRCERRVESAGERPRQVSAAALECRYRPADTPRRGGRSGATHRVAAGEALIENERKGIEVRLLADLRALALLGCHVGERA